MAAKWLGFEIESCDSSHFTSHFDRRKTHQTLSFSWTLYLMYHVDQELHRSQYIPFCFEYNTLRQSRPPDAERSNHISVMFRKWL